jgi:hypothetical protein
MDILRSEKFAALQQKDQQIATSMALQSGDRK